MKCYTAGLSLENGLQVARDPFPHVAVGIMGHERQLTRVPLGRKDFSPPPDRLARAAFIRTREKGTLLLVKEQKGDRDTRALVLINTPSGYRGTTVWEMPDTVEVLAEGRHAIGDGGKLGTYVARLVIMPVGTTVRVHRSGVLNDSSAVAVLHWDGEEMHFGWDDDSSPPVGPGTEDHARVIRDVELTPRLDTRGKPTEL